MVATANIKPVAGECAASDYSGIVTSIHAEHEASADGIGAWGDFQLSTIIPIRSPSAAVIGGDTSLPVVGITPEMIIARVGIPDIGDQARLCGS